VAPACPLLAPVRKFDHYEPSRRNSYDLSVQGRKLVESALEESGKTPYTFLKTIFFLKEFQSARR
jgi:hypothetical protein